MDSLKDIVRQVVTGYAGKALNGCSYLTQSEDSLIFAVVDVGRIQGKHFAGVSLVVRIVQDYVIVERDQNDKLVIDALVQAGIPRNKIVLAYAGELAPEVTG
jgi:XisI protein